MTSTSVDGATAERIARMVLAAVHREYPNQLSLLLESDADLRPPRELTPAFYGSFDWHSAVHGHWCLVRMARCFPSAAFVADARRAVGESLTPERIAGEAAFVRPRPAFERPYGLAWLLQLSAELGEWDDRDARAWHEAVAPLESLAVTHLRAWLEKLPWPIRGGGHGQTAFAMGLFLDWARAAGEHDVARLIGARAFGLFGADLDAPISYEPSGHDFLSAILGEADLMRRVMARDEFASWLGRFLPDLAGHRAKHWLTPVTSPDPADGHLAHLDGLNLSRAWMLEGIAAALPAGDARGALLTDAAARHRAAGLAAVTGEHYAGAHWLGSYAIYLVTARGLG